MAYSMTIAGNAEYPQSGSLNVIDNINDRSTASFSIISTNTITVGQQVIILSGATRVFGGTIDSFKVTNVPKGSSIKKYDLTCVDFNQIADRRRVAQVYENRSVTYIVNDIITNYLSAEGITAGTIQTGPTLTKVVFNRKTITECFDYIKSVTGLNWNIDYNKHVNIFYREDYTDTGFSTALGNIIEYDVEQTRQEYRNRQIIRAGQDTTTVQTLEKPSPKPDGITRTFSTRYPLAKKPTIYIDSVAIADADVGINGVDTNKKWYWNKGERAFTQDSSETVLIDTKVLQITYYGLVKIIIQSDNAAGQAERLGVEGGTGVYEEVEDVASIDTRNAALAYANGVLSKYANIAQIITIQTQTFKLAGKLIPVTIPSLGISGDYLIESVDTTEIDGNIFYTIRCLSGESLGSWVEFFRKLKTEATDFVIQGDEILIVLSSQDENFGVQSTNTIDIFTALYPSNSLYPSNTLYPNTLSLEVVLND